MTKIIRVVLLLYPHLGLAPSEYRPTVVYIKWPVVGVVAVSQNCGDKDH